MNIERIYALPLSFWVGASSIASVYIVITIMLFLGYRKLDYMESRLNKCPLIKSSKNVWGGSPRGRMKRIEAIFFATTFIRLNHKRKAIDFEQAQSFPKGLKILIQGCYLTFLIDAIIIIAYKFVF